MINLDWSNDMAYAVGLLATDGYLSIDKRHLELTSKDEEQLKNLKKCLNLDSKISSKNDGRSGRCGRIQFGDVRFYRWLLNIGFRQQKTKSIGELDIPKKFFFDFLRGHFDGDGSVYAYSDLRWKNSYMIYCTFLAKNPKHLEWLQQQIKKYSGLEGKIGEFSRVARLRYAKKASIGLYKQMYYDKNVVSLSRKRTKFCMFVENAEVEKFGKLATLRW